MIETLAYFGLESPKYEEWEEFGTTILGVQPTDRDAGGIVRLRVDDAAWRLAIHPGEQDRIAYIGWALKNEHAVHAYVERLRSYGVEVFEGGVELYRDREVAGLWWFMDPYGNRHEIVWGQKHYPGTFQPSRPHSGFVTGDQGLGHAVLVVPEKEAANDFYCRVMGFQLSDAVITEEIDIRFYHINARHHSLAVVYVPGKVGLNHLMLETKSLDDVGTAIDLCQQHKVPITLSLGRHVNDHMTSFYVATPSGFQIEYGWGGATVDTQNWLPSSYVKPSIWGHQKTEHYARVPQGIMSEFQETPV